MSTKKTVLSKLPQFYCQFPVIPIHTALGHRKLYASTHNIKVKYKQTIKAINNINQINRETEAGK